MNFQNEMNSYLHYLLDNYKSWSRVQDEPDEVRRKIREDMTNEFANKLRYKEGSKYIKVIQGTSVHSFIVKEDGPKFKKGDILKAASWNAPATNFARGNVLCFNYGNVSWAGA
jgi:hypothetical protein